MRYLETESTSEPTANSVVRGTFAEVDVLENVLTDAFWKEPSCAGASCDVGSPKRCQPGVGAAVPGTTMSSINLRVTCSSPFIVGRGPRAGSIMTFHGHNGGSIHSATSRLAWPLPTTSPALSTL